MGQVTRIYLCTVQPGGHHAVWAVVIRGSILAALGRSYSGQTARVSDLLGWDSHIKGYDLTSRFTREVLCIPPTTCGVKTRVMERARNSSDPESPQYGAAAWHCKAAEVTFPVGRESAISAWGTKSTFNRTVSLIWCVAWLHGLHWAGYHGRSELHWGSPTTLILMVITVLYSVQTCLELQKQLQGVARGTKKLH